MTTAPTLPNAARAFGDVAGQASGRLALRELGLSGHDAPAFVCALRDTRVEEVAPYAPAVVLVIDMPGERLATLTITGGPSDDAALEARATTLGFLLDRIEHTGQSDLSVAILGEVHSQIAGLVA